MFIVSTIDNFKDKIIQLTIRIGKSALTGPHSWYNSEQSSTNNFSSVVAYQETEVDKDDCSGHKH